MGVQGAEPRGEVPVLHRRQALVLEEDDLVPKQGRLDVRELLVIQRPGQVDILHQGADGGRQGAGRDPGHVGDPLWLGAGSGPAARGTANPAAGVGRSEIF